MRTATMLLPLMLLASGCGDRPPLPIPVAPDAAQLVGCARTFPALPALTPLSPFTLPDGRRVVLLEVVRARDEAVARYIAEDAMGAWHSCVAPVEYVTGWSARMQGEQHGR